MECYRRGQAKHMRSPETEMIHSWWASQWTAMHQENSRQASKKSDLTKNNVNSRNKGVGISQNQIEWQQADLQYCTFWSVTVRKKIWNSQSSIKTTATRPASFVRTRITCINSGQALQKIGLYRLEDPVSCHACRPQCKPETYVGTMTDPLVI